MLEHGGDRLAQARIGLDLLGVQLIVPPRLEAFHHGLAVSLGMNEPLLRAHLLFPGLSVHAVDRVASASVRNFGSGSR
jgi:hypothetical protein